MRKLLCAAAAAGLLISASGAFAQAPAGSVVFIERSWTDPNDVNQTLQLWHSGTNATSFLFDLPNSVGVNPLGGVSDSTSSISDIFEVNGRWYLSDGPFPPENPLTGRIWQIDDLFGAPVMTELSGPSTAGNVLSRPLGFAWDEVRNQLLVINNQDQTRFRPCLVLKASSESIPSQEPRPSSSTKQQASSQTPSGPHTQDQDAWSPIRWAIRTVCTSQVPTAEH